MGPASALTVLFRLAGIRGEAPCIQEHGCNMFPIGIAALSQGYDEGATNYWKRREAEETSSAQQEMGAGLMQMLGGIPQGPPPMQMPGPGGPPGGMPSPGGMPPNPQPAPFLTGGLAPPQFGGFPGQGAGGNLSGGLPGPP